MVETQTMITHVMARHIRAPKPEKLRVLILGASSEGGLRVGREQKRIRSAAESALHRDLIELDVRPARPRSPMGSRSTQPTWLGKPRFSSQASAAQTCRH